MNQRERAAIEAVARRFSASWDDSAALLTAGGKRIALDTIAFETKGAGPRLRFDKAVIRLMERLRGGLREAIPDGVTVLLTVIAPIRLPSKTAAALEEKIRAIVGRASGRDVKDTIHGNLVRIRLVRHTSERAPKLIGFVHNSDADSPLLLNLTSELLERFAAPPKKPGDRWLAMIGAGKISNLEPYRYICSELRLDFDKIVIVSGDGHVELL